MKRLMAFLLLACVQHVVIAQNVTQAEYFLDTDAGFGQNTLVSFTPAADGSFSFSINLTGVAAGFHKLFIRTRDSDGKWSHTTRRTIEVLASEVKNNIVSGEYYINVDPGFGNANLITVTPQDSIILQNFTAAVVGLPNGYHKLYGRFRDLYGNWSHTFRRNIEVEKGGDNAVMLVEYFFDTDAGFGNCTSTTFATPLPDGTFNFNIPLNQIAADADTLFLRVKDSANTNWSITAYKVNPITLPLTLLSFNGTLLNNIVQLNWETVNELNTAYFTIERSTDGASFSALGKVNARGNTTTATYYNYEDVPGITGKIFYRLKQVDRDGRIQYSPVIVLKIGGRNLLFTIQPNPAKNYFTITANTYTNSPDAVLTITEMTGKVIRKEKLVNSIQTINIAALSKGVYIISIVTPGTTHTEKLVVE